MCSEFLFEILNGPQLGGFEGVLVGNWDGDVLGPSYGGLVGIELKDCHVVHLMGPGRGDV